MKLSQLDSEAGFQRAGMGREDVENHFSAVEDFDFQFEFKVSILRWRKIVVEQNNVGSMKVNQLFQLNDFPFPDVRCRVGLFAPLNNTRHHDRSSRFGKTLNFLKWVELYGIVRKMNAHNDRDLLIDLVFFLAILHVRVSG